MSDQMMELGKLLADLRDHFQACAESIDAFLNVLGAPPEEKAPEVYDQLPWETREGAKGPFQTVNKRSCGNSDLYRHLFNIVKVNMVNGEKFSHSIGDYYYWLDTRDNPTDPTAIFRRRKKAAQEAKKK